MDTPAFVKYIFASSGAVGIVVGIFALIVPTSFHASSGITIGDQVALLNELRGTGGSLLALGSFVFATACLRRQRRISGIVSALLYLSYAGARALSLALDGKPTNELLVVMLFEAAIGCLVLFTWLKYRQSLAAEAR